MSTPENLIGRTYPPTEPYEVGLEKIREFAAALGDPNPAYRDRAAAQALGHPDVIAPPTFAIVVTGAASERLIEDPDLGIDFSRVVHGEQQFDYARPLRAGDVVVTTTTLQDVRTVAGNAMITSRSEVSTMLGEHVLTARSMIVVRGGQG